MFCLSNLLGPGNFAPWSTGAGRSQKIIFEDFVTSIGEVPISPRLNSKNPVANRKMLHRIGRIPFPSISYASPFVKIFFDQTRLANERQAPFYYGLQPSYKCFSGELWQWTGSRTACRLSADSLSPVTHSGWPPTLFSSNRTHFSSILLN